MAFDAFISYSSKDKIAADATCAVLEGAGIRCWIAPRDIRPGGEYAAAIVDAIDHCRVMVLIFSSSANDSAQIRREIERAVSKGIPIVPVRIEEVIPTKSMEYFLGSIHWLDALTQPIERHLRRLADTVNAILQADALSQGSPVEGDVPTHSASGLASRARLRFGDASVPAGARRDSMSSARMRWLLALLAGAVAVFGSAGAIWLYQSRAPLVAVAPRTVVAADLSRVILIQKFIGDGDIEQCNVGAYGEKILSPASDWSPFVRIDSDDRQGGCLHSLGLVDAGNILEGLEIAINFISDGDGGVCGNPGHRVIPISRSLGDHKLSDPMKYDTDSRPAGCQQTYSLKGRNDVAFQIEFLPDGNAGQCENAGMHTVLVGQEASIRIKTDNRFGGCRLRYRLVPR